MTTIDHDGTPGTSSPDPPRAQRPRERKRLVGIDAARGLALVGMVAVHILPAWNPVTDEATLQWTLSAGRSAALFALLAGVGLSFSSGGRTPHEGRQLRADRAGVAVRAALITVVGLLVNTALPEDPPAYDILVYYGVFFLLALPFLHLRARALFLWAGGFAAGGPVVIHVLGPVLPAMQVYNPTPADVLADPGTVLSQVLVTGTYPAVTYLAYLLAGLGIARLDLSAPRVQVRLLAGGAALGLGAWLASWVLILQTGGYDQLLAATPWLGEDGIDEILTYGPDGALPTTTWWWLLVAGPHTNTPLAVLHALGASAAVLGALLLIARRAGRWLLPLSAAGSMTLTLYSAHLLGLSLMLHYDQPGAWFTVHLVLALFLSVAWRRAFGQGPLERVVGATVRGVRSGVLGRPGRPPGP